MNRKGYIEHTWFTFSYSPVRDESGKVAGMFCAVSETTRKVLAERALRELNATLGKSLPISWKARTPSFRWLTSNASEAALPGEESTEIAEFGDPARDRHASRSSRRRTLGKGSGSGLPQVYGFAQQSGGRVTIESVVGVGTVVTRLKRWRMLWALN